MATCGKCKAKEKHNASACGRFNSIKKYLKIGNMRKCPEKYDEPPPMRAESTYFFISSDIEMIGSFDYFLDNIEHAKADIDASDFADFWLDLDDAHKERRLLVAYFCATRGVIEMGASDESAESMSSVLFEKSLYHDLFSAYLSTMSRILIVGETKKKRTKKLREAITRIFADYLGDPYTQRFVLSHSFKDFFYADFRPFFDHLCGDDDDDDGNIGMANVMLAVSEIFFVNIFNGFAALYLCRRELVDSVGGDVEELERKLRVAVPHWCWANRDYLLRAVEDGISKSCNGTYVDRLLASVGPNAFKLIAFGKEKFCANCGRSSYTGEERLLCCKLCVKEMTSRPRARYCNAECQKAHWPKHKLEAHPIPSCASCGLVRSGLRTCKRCLDEGVGQPARYCDDLCQKDDWTEHRRKAHRRRSTNKDDGDDDERE